MVFWAGGEEHMVHADPTAGIEGLISEEHIGAINSVSACVPDIPEV